MRGGTYALAALGVMCMAFWAYQENYRTRNIKEVRILHSQIGAAHERLRMLNAEWAYLNRQTDFLISQN